MFIFLGLRIILETSAVVVWKDMMAHLCVYKEPLAAAGSSFLIHPNPAHLYHNVTYPSISLASAKSDKTTGYSHQQTTFLTVKRSETVNLIPCKEPKTPCWCSLLD
jgi:hypothetical protein